MQALRIVSGLEALSLAALLLNLATVHAPAVTSVGGPVHGTVYLSVIVLTWLMPTAAAPGARWRALVPGFGGLLVLRCLAAEAAASADRHRRAARNGP